VLSLGLVPAEVVRRRISTGSLEGQRGTQQAGLCVVVDISTATDASSSALVVIWLAFAVIGDLLGHTTVLPLSNYRIHVSARDVESSAYSSASVLRRRRLHGCRDIGNDRRGAVGLPLPSGQVLGGARPVGAGAHRSARRHRGDPLQHLLQEGQCLPPDQADTGAWGPKTSRSQIPGVCAKESGKLRSRIRRASWNRKLSGWPRPKS
jgi:hypothetical protein